MKEMGFVRYRRTFPFPLRGAYHEHGVNAGPFRACHMPKEKGFQASLMPFSFVIWRSCRLLALTPFVIPLGFEPKTHSLEGCCSVQLSYGTKTAPLKAPTKILNFSVLRLSLPVSRAYPCS